MEVYVDGAFVLNALVDYLLLAGGARLAGAVQRRRRLVLASLLGGSYAALSFLPGLAWLTGLPCRMVVLIGILLLAYGTGRRALIQSVLFLLLCLALCGLVLALSSLLGAQIWLLGGRAYYAVGFGSLVLLAGALYCGSWQLLQGTAAHTGG